MDMSGHQPKNHKNDLLDAQAQHWVLCKVAVY